MYTWYIEESVDMIYNVDADIYDITTKPNTQEYKTNVCVSQ